MRIEVDKISSETEIELEEDINASEWDLDSFDIKFIDNIHLFCSFLRVGKEIIVNAEVLTKRDIVCSRCLEEFKQEDKYNFKLFYNVASLGDYLDVDKDLREEIILNFPMKVLCKPDCKGLCPQCGANLNIEKCDCNGETENSNLKRRLLNGTS